MNQTQSIQKTSLLDQKHWLAGSVVSVDISGKLLFVVEPERMVLAVRCVEEKEWEKLYQKGIY